MTDPFSKLRQQIDQVDTELVQLLARRKALVAEVGELKQAAGVPIYVPTREHSLIQARREEALAAGVSPELIEDLLRRMMRESYSAENEHGFQCCAPELESVVIVGGRGQMGQLFTRMFCLSGYQVASLDLDNQEQAKELLAEAGLIIISVPINQTDAVIRKQARHFNPQALLVDFTSRKSEPMATMLGIHPGPVLGLHPMFGPDVCTLAKQVMVFTPGRGEAKFEPLLQQFRLWGASLIESSPAKHDHMMAIIQALRHFTTFAYGSYLQRENIQLEDVSRFSSPIYRLELAMVGRLFAQDPQLYADIIFSSTEGKQLIRNYIEHLQEAVVLLDNNDIDGFIQQFTQTSDWFGQLKEKLLDESTALLERQSEHQ